MSTPDGAFHLVFNGEIYNHPDLMKELTAEGVDYRTHCDTETLLHLMAREGLKGIPRLQGMFAFGLWATERKRLLLVRDRLGIKPLYYVHQGDGSLFFSSEIKGLLAGDAVRPTLNYRALPDYLANHAPSGEETLFEGIRRLPPGHFLTWEDGRVEVRRYWQLSFEKRQKGRTEEDLIEEFVHRFRVSVRRRLMSDVPLGAFLSGGIDSTAITGMMSGMMDEPVRTFSVGFAEREANELEFARKAAEAYGAVHREIVVTPQQFFGHLPRMVWHEDEPIAHSASIPLNSVSELSAQDVKVVLTGEGSDELLGGYSRYWKTLQMLEAGRVYHRLVPASLRKGAARAVAAMAPHSTLARKLTRTPLLLNPEIRELYLDNFAVFSTERQGSLLSAETGERCAGIDPHGVLEHLLEASTATDLLDRLLDVDIQVYLGELLMKQDQMSMAASIESRVPFLDHELVEFVSGLPVNMKVRGRTTKYVLRKGLEGFLPKEILHRPKQGFPVPLSRWFRGEFRSWVDEFVLGGRAMGRGLFSVEGVQELAAEHVAGRADHGQRLWSLVNLEVWQRIFMDGEAVEDVTAALETRP
jgi:asparagine synthase (glutamine-hydrolysing)